MAAGAACVRGLRVTVVEHNPKGPGQKLLITGKGRCNVTSDSDVRDFLPFVRHNGRFLYSSLYAFPPSAAMELFEELGVPLKTERGRRVFPQSDRAADVLAALRAYARDARFVRGKRPKSCCWRTASARGPSPTGAKLCAPRQRWWPPAASATRPPAATAAATPWPGRRGTPSCRPSPACAAWLAPTRPAAG